MPNSQLPNFGVLAQAAEVPDGGQERFLHQVEGGLLVAHEFKYKDI